MPTIRPSTPADVPAITAIYGQHVLYGTGTFETTPPTEADMTARRADVLSKGLPYLVAEEGGKLLGFAYCQWFKPRPAYRFSAEDSIYLHPDAAGKGVGTQLLGALAAEAEAAGIRKLIAVSGDSGNAGSIGVHRTRPELTSPTHSTQPASCQDATVACSFGSSSRPSTVRNPRYTVSAMRFAAVSDSEPWIGSMSRATAACHAAYAAMFHRRMVPSNPCALGPTLTYGTPFQYALLCTARRPGRAKFDTS